MANIKVDMIMIRAIIFSCPINQKMTIERLVTEYKNQCHKDLEFLEMDKCSLKLFLENLKNIKIENIEGDDVVVCIPETPAEEEGLDIIISDIANKFRKKNLLFSQINTLIKKFKFEGRRTFTFDDLEKLCANERFPYDQFGCYNRDMLSRMISRLYGDGLFYSYRTQFIIDSNLKKDKSGMLLKECQHIVDMTSSSSFTNVVTNETDEDLGVSKYILNLAMN